MSRFSPWFKIGVCVVFLLALCITPVRAEEAQSHFNFSSLKDGKEQESREMAPAQMGMKSVEALGVCLLVLCGVVYGLKRSKRFNSGAKRAHMSIKERIALSNKHSLVKVQIGSSEVVLALSPDGVQQINLNSLKGKKRRKKYDFDQVLSDGPLQLAVHGGE